MDPTIVVKQERLDQSLDMTFGDLSSSTLQQPMTSEDVSPTNEVVSERSKSIAHFKLDIKPNVNDIKVEEDDGQKTPPIPRLVGFPALIETVSVDKDKGENVGVPKPIPMPVTEVDQVLNVSKTATTLIRASSSVPNIVTAFQQEDVVNEIVSLEFVRNLQRQLDVTRHDFQQHLQKSISATNLLQPETHINEQGHSQNTLEQNHKNVFPSTARPNHVREEGCQTDNVSQKDAISESAATHLNSKLKLVEKNAMESFKKIEVRQTSMLEEIRKTNETLEKLLRNVGSTRPSEMEMMWVPEVELNDQYQSPDDDIDYFVVLPAIELNLRQEEWVEQGDDEDSDERDYEMLAFEYHQVDRGNFNDVMDYPHKQRANIDAIAISPPETVHQRDESMTGFVCTCGSRFRLLTTLGDHLLYKNRPRFQCNLCSKQLYKRRELITHVRNTHKIIVQDDRFVCFSCNSRFASSLEMFSHKRTCPVLNERTKKGNKKKSRTALDSSSMEDIRNSPI